MTSFKQISCRLCFETLNDTNCEVIDNCTRKVIGVLQLNLNEESKEVMCNACSEKLNAALEFKSMCINTYNTIISYADKNVLLLDLRQVYMLENGMTNVGSDQKICRLCFQIVPNEFRHINETQLENIQKFAPEMNTIIMKDPVMCKSCFDSLYAHNLFLKNCAEVEREIENIRNHSDIKRCTETNPDLFVKNENFEEDFEINESEISIKAECVEIKSEEEEEEEEDSNDLLASVNEKPVNSPQMEKFKHSHARMHKYKTNHNRHRLVHKRHLCEPQMYACDACTFKTDDNNAFDAHRLGHKSSLNIRRSSQQLSTGKAQKKFKCNLCDYTGKYSTSVLVHKLLKHGDESKTDKRDIHRKARNKQRPERQPKRKLSAPKQIYKCTICTFETKNKRGLKRHELRHKDKPVSKTYKCDFCEFKTMFEKCLMVHQASHKISWQGGTYKCTVCSFETEQRQVIAYHVLEHKITSGDGDIQFEATNKQRPEHQPERKLSPPAQMYKCTVCTFQTKYKQGLKIHELRSHKNKPVSKTYKCDFCEFKTMFRKCLMVHQTSHKISSQEGTYKCTVCSFETEQRHVIAYHVLKHKITGEDGDIHFEATNKQGPEHQPEGKLSPPTQMYKCTKYKQDLKRHELNHKGKPVSKMYKCDFCDFETIVRRHLKVHQTSHKISWQRGMYKCIVCNFETEERHVIAYHGLKHKVPSGDADKVVQVIE